MQQQAHPRILFREALEYWRQDVAGLGVRGRDGERTHVLGFEFGADALQIVELLQRAAGRGHDDFSACGQRGEPLALADEDWHAELVLELPDLFADPRLRGEQRIGGDRDVQAVIDDGAQIADLLEIHRYDAK